MWPEWMNVFANVTDGRVDTTIAKVRVELKKAEHFGSTNTAASLREVLQHLEGRRRSLQLTNQGKRK